MPRSSPGSGCRRSSSRSAPSRSFAASPKRSPAARAPSPDFPRRFLALGNGFVPRRAGAGLDLCSPSPLGVWLLVHRTTFGRSFRAIGFAPEGARYAGLPVERRLALAYTLAGAVAGLAAVIFVSRVTEARANAGIGYELAAITAVVLGGTSIFGGIGTVHGTLLGVAAVAVLANGLSRIVSIMAISRELSGMLTGALLLLALGRRLADQPHRLATHPRGRQPPSYVRPPLIPASLRTAGLPHTQPHVQKRCV